ncbi:MAG: hypothetical protein LBL83_08380, partial [Clostridiales bacterium]|nr:hypothetical protein [Clostridiales bacterium]
VSAGTVAGPRGHRVRAPEAGAAGGATESAATGAKRGTAGSLARGAAEGVAEGEALLGRPRVIALFGQAAQNPLVTVTAGPGYGKTCAVREFLGVAPSARAVWADCDPQGGVPAFFWRAVAGAARGEFSGSPAKPEGAGLPGGAGESGARSRSAEEAPSAESPVYYVADGYEFGASAATDRRLGQAAALMPRHSSIIAIGRRSARLGLSGLKCGMGEISARDLAFTAEEARLLFELHGRRISPGRAAEITDFTEGWALALRLLLRGGDQAAGLGGRGAGANPAQLSALFESEYYAEYGAGVRLMLSRLSLLPEFTLDIARRALLAGGQSAGARGKRGAGGNSDESGANCENGEGGAKGIGGAGGAGGKSGAKDSVSHAKGGAGGNSDESGVNCENGEGGEGCVAGPRGGAPAEADEAAGVVEAVEAADVADVVAAAVADAVEEGEGIDAADVAEATATADVAEAAEITEIAEAIRANPFIGYDGRSGLYFFHGMYRAFLAERLPMPGEGEQRRLWRGAGGAFLEAGHFARAAGCYARGGAYGMALESMCRHIGASAGITRETAARFEEMLERLPPGYGDQNPLAGYVRAQIDLNRLDAGRAFGRLADAESRLNALPPGERPEFWPELLGDIYYTMGLARLMQNDASFPEYFRKASGLLPNGSPLRAPRKLCLGSNSVLALGDSAPGALRRMEEAVREAAPHFTRVAKGGGSGYACLFSAEAAYSTLDFGAARQNSYRAIFEAEEARQHDIACGARVILAKIALMAGEHDEFFGQVDCVQRGADSPRGALREGLGAASGGIGWRGAVSGRAPGERISAGRAPAERTPAERAAALGWAAGRPPAPGAAGLDPAQGATGRAPGQAPGPQRAAATGAPEIAPAPGLASALAPAAAALASAPKSASAPGLPGYAPAPGAPARLTAPELSPAPGLPRHAPAPESPKRPPAPKPSLAPERLPAPELSPAPRLRGHAPAPGAPARPPAPEFSPAPYAPAMDDLREFALNWMYLKMGDLKALTPWIAEHGAAS